MPYHPDLPLSKQIPASVESSLRNLRVEEDESSSESAYIDCLLLHSPLPSEVETSYAWKVMQSYVPARIRHIGISNVGVKELTDIWRMAGVHPAVVQNRWHEGNQWDREVRAFCREKGIVYESFWTLTGNPGLLKSEPVQRLSQEAGVNRQAALYSLVVELGIAPLNGTTSKERMDEDLKGVANVGNWSLVYAEKWESIVGEFKAIVDGP
jgi:diketogulonate reductase-like aldo/keto reductase